VLVVVDVDGESFLFFGWGFGLGYGLPCDVVLYLCTDGLLIGTITTYYFLLLAVGKGKKHKDIYI